MRSGLEVPGFRRCRPCHASPRMNPVFLACGLWLLLACTSVLAEPVPPTPTPVPLAASATPATGQTAPVVPTPVQAEPSPATAASASPAASPAPPPSATPSVAADEEQLLGIQQEWADACLHADAEYVARLLTDDWVYTNERAEMSSKAAEIQQTRERTVRYTVFENHDMTVHLHGDAAVVTGRTRFKGTIAASGKLIEADVQFTDTFVRIEGRWRVAATHVSRAGG